MRNDHHTDCDGFDEMKCLQFKNGLSLAIFFNVLKSTQTIYETDNRHRLA